MNRFSFDARDVQGNTQSGQLDAPDTNAAIRELGRRGLRVISIRPVAPAAPAPARPAQASKPQAASPVRPTPAAPNAPAARPNARTSDADAHFAFSQIAQRVRAGLSPAGALRGVGGAWGKPGASEALVRAGDRAAQGASLADALAEQPNQFSSFTIGMVRAGELGGFLPEALEVVSKQAFRAHKFRRTFWWVGVLVANLALGVPTALIARAGILKALTAIEGTGGQGGFSEALRFIGGGLGQALIWPIGPIALAVSLVCWLAWLWWKRPARERARHRLAYVWPVFGKRARAESASVFSWTLSRLAQAGLPPHRVWQAACDAVPNLEASERYRQAGRLMHEGSKLSDAFVASGLFTHEEASIMSTGETIGDVPGTLTRISSMQRAELDSAEGYAKWRGGCWGALGCFVTAAFMMGTMMYVWYVELPRIMLQGLE